jgi:lysophospholipase L1-like esterase
LDTPEREAVRQAANTWIRTSGEFDAVFDFAAALADPADPSALDPAFDSGDGLHPNDAGCQAIADAVDLRALLR